MERYTYFLSLNRAKGNGGKQGKKWKIGRKMNVVVFKGHSTHKYNRIEYRFLCKNKKKFPFIFSKIEIRMSRERGRGEKRKSEGRKLTLIYEYYFFSFLV